MRTKNGSSNASRREYDNERSHGTPLEPGHQKPAWPRAAAEEAAPEDLQAGTASAAFPGGRRASPHRVGAQSQERVLHSRAHLARSFQHPAQPEVLAGSHQSV